MRRMLLAASAAMFALLFALAASAAPPTKSGSFVNYSLGEATGTTCPGSSACSNIASEPAIRADGAGRFFGSRVKARMGWPRLVTQDPPDGQEPVRFTAGVNRRRPRRAQTPRRL